MKLLLLFLLFPFLSSAYHGTFLHLTDIHPDPFIKEGYSIAQNCHKGHKGEVGKYGAPLNHEKCDSPLLLMNATFHSFVQMNISIDFIVWTGDNARHDLTVGKARTPKEIFDLNERVVEQFRHSFPAHKDPSIKQIPIIPSLGNNDIFPHNILRKGPNTITKTLAHIWKDFIPEDQIHVFQRGAYFFNEVIPHQLAVISLNTIYFYNANSAVDGCNIKHDPGYIQFEWLRVQLELFRQRNMKVLLTGHVPPSAHSWYSGCFEKYLIWSTSFSDVISAHLYGHNNMDHFYVLNKDDVKDSVPREKRKDLKNTVLSKDEIKDDADGEISITKSKKTVERYLDNIRREFGLVPKNISEQSLPDWHTIFVSPSVVPVFYPTFRIFHYNISNLDEMDSANIQYHSALSFETDTDNYVNIQKKKKKKEEKIKPPPLPPAANRLGPAFRNQDFSLLGYEQYYANITRLNGNLSESFKYELEYNTWDEPYELADLTAQNILSIAREIGSAWTKESEGLHTLTRKEKELYHAYLKRAFVATGLEKEYTNSYLQISRNLSD